MISRYGKYARKQARDKNQGPAQKAKLSQDELARKSDVAYTTLTKTATGVIKSPSIFVVAKIAKVLGVSVDDLLQ